MAQQLESFEPEDAGETCQAGGQGRTPLQQGETNGFQAEEPIAGIP